MRSSIQEFDEAITASEAWVKDVEYLLSPCNADEAFLAWRVVMTQVREALPPDTVRAAADALPLLLRGAFLSHWDPASPQLTEGAEFLARIAAGLPRSFPWEAEPVARAVLESLTHSVDEAISTALIGRLPSEIQLYALGTSNTATATQ